MKFLILLSGLLFSGCVTTGFISPLGSAIFKIDQEPVTLGPSPIFVKKGEACSINLFGLYAGGDSSLIHAMQKGGISKVGVVDRSVTNIFLVYGQVCTIVYGE
ncbi:TRL domain-containing protein [Leptospira kobayashii]|uniref:TRL domain-containing protein n=1 Tax=Leptospira kobayashii TaxID=1917830 RepID=UPI000D596C03|nr:TRL domain-containing protein [Leptospira kobayashii]